MTSKNVQRKKITDLLKQLEKQKTVFDKTSASKKISLINQLKKIDIYNYKQLITYHDILTFLRAYPENAAMLKLVEKELKGFGKRVDYYKQNSRDKSAAKLLNSGIINTTVEHPYSLGALKFLLNKYPDLLSIDWDNLLETVQNEIFSTLPHLVSYHENDALDNDDLTDVPGWLLIAGQNKSKSDVETLVKIFNASDITDNIKEYLFDKFDVPISWSLADSTSSRTMKRWPNKKIFFQKDAIRKRTTDLRAEFKKPTAPLKLLSVKESIEAIQTANEVLAVRYRELQPITFANPKEVYLYEPGRGIQIYIFGSTPDTRLPLESNYGAMLVRNGLPIGYGVAATLFERVEIAINVFPAFRTGESSFIIEQFFKLFYKHFGSKVFLVNSYQMGDGDDEPIQSGTFWFYYKLGFRAVNKRIRNMAEKEFKKIQIKSNYRSSFQTLKRLSKSDVFMHTDIAQMDGFQDLSLMNLGYVVTKYIGQKYNGDRKLAVLKSIQKLEKNLNIRGLKNWSNDEIKSLERMAPLIVCMPNLSKLCKTDKDNLTKIIRAKGSNRERTYTLLSIKHSFYKNAFIKMASQ